MTRGETPDPRHAYVEREAAHRVARDRSRWESRRLSTARVVTFLAAAGAWVLSDVLTGTPGGIAFGVALGLLIVFFALVSVHARVRRRRRVHEARRSLAEEGLLRLDRDWEGLDAILPEAERIREEVPADHPYAVDLDVCGRTSVVRLLGPVTSTRGRRVLRDWLLSPPRVEEARARREAAEELAPLLDLRMEVTVHGRLDAATGPGGIERFLGWAAAGRDGVGTGLRWAAWVLPLSTLVLLLSTMNWGIPPFWVVPALAQLVLARRVGRRAASDFSAVALGSPALRAYVPQLRLLEGREWDAAALRRIGERLGAGDGAAHLALRRLSRLADMVESRRNMFYAVLAVALLADLHLAIRLDAWRGSWGARAVDWLDALGEWEALAALASPAHDHPEWTFPEWRTSGPPGVEARALGHPLLPPARCVGNEVTVGPPGTFLLVTGSNMSGKSTLLRALGANVILAGAGAPVCASYMALSPLRVRTCMRVEDSLAQGVSLFMAELLRVKQIVEAADAGEDGVPPVLYLLDEILHGTNTAERRVAARGVIRYLLGSGSVGAVSTHDLTLADAPDLERAAHAVHFRETVHETDGATRLTFDYTLRPGVATTRNALRLLEAVGLGGLELDGD